MAQLDRPLLCSSAKGNEADENGPLDAARLLDIYGPQGLEFVVDAGPRAPEDSTVVDMSGPTPQLVRLGKGEWHEDW